MTITFHLLEPFFVLTNVLGNVHDVGNVWRTNSNGNIIIFYIVAPTTMPFRNK